MKATIASDRRVVAVSWAVACGIFLAGWLALLWLAEPAGTIPSGAEREKPRAARRAKEEGRAKRRPLPKEYAGKMVESAEVLVKRELKERLRLFEKIDLETARKEHRLLDLVQARPLRAGAAPDINDVSAARDGGPPLALAADAGIEQLYERIALHEARIQRNHLGSQAAGKALEAGLSFPEALAAMKQGATRMPGFRDLVMEVNRQSGLTGNQMPQPRTIEDLDRYREVLAGATRQSGLAESRLMGMLHQFEGRQSPPMAGNAGGSGSGNGGLAGAVRSARGGPLQYHRAKFQSEQMVAAQALPGRRFSRDTLRRGWLYVNTWYMIGPWESHGRNDFLLSFPPERGVDLDAVYQDGQTGPGIAETDSHPLEMHGPEVLLDGSLRWKFMQSESMHNVMPVTTDSSVCYAYTELYFDEPASMLVAIGTDDSGKVWINGREIWKDTGASWYHIDEHLEVFDFQRGWNRVLVRLDNNGGAASGFSFLICPKDAVLAEDGSRRR